MSKSQKTKLCSLQTARFLLQTQNERQNVESPIFATFIFKPEHIWTWKSFYCTRIRRRSCWLKAAHFVSMAKQRRFVSASPCEKLTNTTESQTLICGSRGPTYPGAKDQCLADNPSVINNPLHFVDHRILEQQTKIKKSNVILSRWPKPSTM